MGRSRMTAAQRSEQLVSAAITAFSAGGYAGTTTDDVARLAGVSQPYVIRLFGSKRRLFIAGFEHATDQIEQVFSAAGTDLDALARAYRELLAQRELLAMMLHGFAAGSDPVIGEVVRDRFGRIYRLVGELTGASAGQVREFLADGMLFTILASVGVVGPDAVPAQPWMTELIAASPFGDDSTEAPSARP